VIKVLGIGNVLMSDDGFGPFVIRVLEAAYECPPDVEFVDAGTPGLDLTPYLMGTDAVIFVDTVSSRGVPGAIRIYDRDAILKVPPQARTGGHDPALKEALLTVEAAGAGPSRVTLVGVIPEWIATGVALSPRLEAAVGPAVLAVVEALAALGVHLTRRVHPEVPHIWWAAGAMENLPHLSAE
jgi:hydrogenase maturation protease